MSDNKNTEKRTGQIETLKKVLNYIRKYWILVGLSLILAALTVLQIGRASCRERV